MPFTINENTFVVLVDVEELPLSSSEVFVQSRFKATNSYVSYLLLSHIISVVPVKFVILSIK